MKNKLIYSLVFVAFIFAACNEEFTESKAFGSLSDEQLANAQGIDLKLIAAYSALDGLTNTPGADWHKTGDNWWFDVMSDDAHKGSTDGDQADLFLLETYDWSTTNPYIQNKWRALYASVNRANAVIDLIGKVTDGDFSQQLAEARFLRALFNFDLQKIWGNVAYISEENFANKEFNQPNEGAIWEKIEEDLKFAADNLPNSQSNVGRPTSWTAKAFLGKALLFQGKNATALTTLNDVINNGPYSLLSEFVDNFRLAGENGTESVFAIQFTADAGQSFNGNRGSTLNFPGGGPIASCCGFLQPTQDLVNAYQTDANGLPLLDTFNETDVTSDYGINSDESFTPFAGRLDPRLDYTVGRRDIDFNGWGKMVGKDWIRASFADISGPYLTKKNFYYQGEDANRGTGGWGQQRSGINYHIMRYADVLLMAAEAAVEEDDLPTALKYVNLVRNRAKNMTYVKNEAGTANAANYAIEPYTSFADQTFARKAVRMERRLELATEAHRLFDLRRWDNAAQVMTDYSGNEARVISSFTGKQKAYESKHNLCPIPLNAIDLSGGVLKQNPGY